MQYRLLSTPLVAAMILVGCGPAEQPLPGHDAVISPSPGAAVETAKSAEATRPPVAPPTETTGANPTPEPDKAPTVKPSLLPASPAPPLAKVVPKTLSMHGEDREDPYYWLRDDDRKNPEMLAQLTAENVYTKAAMGPVSVIEKALFEELKGRIDKDDSTVPARKGTHWYYAEFAGDQEYPIHYRKTGTLDAPATPILDVNALAKGHDYIAVTSLRVSSDEHILAYAEDTLSRRVYTIRFKDLRTGKTLEDSVPGTTGSIAWADDSKTLFYVKRDPETLRSRWVYRHTLGSDAADDVLVWDEKDEAYYVTVRQTKSKRFVFIDLQSTITSETRYVDAKTPTGDSKPVLPREKGHEYDVAHWGDVFYVRSNWDAVNFRLLKAPIPTSGDKATWVEVVPHRADVLVTGISAFKDHLVVSERKNTLRSLHIIRQSDGEAHDITFEEPLYTARVGNNPSFDTTTLRFSYASPITPDSVYDYDLTARTRELKKQDTVLGGYDPANYDMKREWAPSRDGKTRIPVSLVYRKGTPQDGTAPVYQYGYGSYGHAMDPSFRPSWVSLIDRGFVVAIAHIRGGEELGRRWYDDGKMLKKMNTFNDFVDVTEFLIAQNYSAKGRVVAAGGSAGGLLVGAVANMRPELYGAIYAAVPFVDVVTTMADASIPLTTNEYDEWGNPADKAYYDYMMTYSPYDNVKAQDYPPIYVATGLHDSQVQYWEPAKWVAKLRATKTDRNLLLFDVDMSAGHGGSSGRFKRYEKTAKSYAFILYVLDMVDLKVP